ncbi:MAG: ABC transporter substrate-binding protein [Chloroflexota bacterium]
MTKVKAIGKTIGLIILGIVVVLALVGGTFFIWLRSDAPEVTECDADHRLFEHAFGISCVPNQPQNVLSYGTAPTQFLVAIGFPMAMTEAGLDEWTSADIPGLYERLREVNKDSPDFGRLGGTVASNVEIVLQIQPDLIISEWLESEDLARTASLIAPAVLLIEDGRTNWKEITLNAGDVIGEKEQAEALIADYEKRVEILRQQFDDPADITVSAVRLWPDNYWIMLEESFSQQIVKDVGFSSPEAQAELTPQATFNRRQIQYNEERPELLDADHIILFPATGNTGLADVDSDKITLTQEFQEEPLFQFLGAVQNGNVYPVDVHWNVTGIYSAHAILDDLFIHVAGVDPEEVAPNPLKLSD